MNKLIKHVLGDVLVILPLIWFGAIQEYSIAVGGLVILSVLWGIVIASTVAAPDVMYRRVCDEWYGRSGAHWIYALSSSFVEMLIFAYTGWWVLAIGYLAVFIMIGNYFIYGGPINDTEA